MRPRISFENQLLLRTLAGGVAAIVILAVVLFTSDLSVTAVAILLAIAIVGWIGFAIATRGFVIYHLQTMSNLLEALREGDYSLRGRRARFDDSLGEVMKEVNALSETLRAERLGAREASALLMKVVDAIDIAVFAFDAGRRLKLVNRAGQRLLQGSEETLLDRTAEYLGIAALLEGESRRTHHHEFPAGSGRWEIRHGTFRADGLPHRLLVITDMSRALRDEERTAWRRLIRVIGHELNNSLAPIKSMTGMLRGLVNRESLPDDWREDMAGGLDVIGSRADALTRFMTAYAMLARLPEPRRRPVDVKRLVERVAALDTRLPLTATGPTVTASIDPDQVEQLLINLVKNAIDAAEQTDGTVEVRWSEENDGLRIAVLDTGPGISNPDNLFVPFFTTKPAGTGIGLVLCRQIAEAHGGSLSLTNRSDGEGCVAMVVLPAAESKAGRPE